MNPEIAPGDARVSSWRRDEKKRQQTRSQLRRTIHPDVVEAECALSSLPDRDLAYLHAGSVKQVRRVVQAARRRVPVEVHPFAGRVVGEPSAVVRPTWILRERHRPAIFPGLVAPEPQAPLSRPMAAIFDKLQTLLRSGRHPYGALDWLHSVSGIPWSRCAEILRRVGTPVDDGAVEMLNAARSFWEQFAEFRRIYLTAVQFNEVEVAEGDWGFVEAHQLSHWLPRLHVPKMQRRDEYLVRLVRRGGPLLDLDFHGNASYKPLFTVQL